MFTEKTKKQKKLYTRMQTNRQNFSPKKKK